VFSKRNRKHVLHVSLESLEELEKAAETLACQLLLPQLFSLSQSSICVSIKQLLLDYELKISIV